ncbi:hypothetical protein FRC11_004036, partial [Ceratobasidium sp. 423]
MSSHTSSIFSSYSINPALAWSLGNGGKGYIVIKFPFTLNDGWYRELPCREFRTFQHRKERKGLRHEFLVLKLKNGWVCRVERMGDPNARLNALLTQGSIAQDLVGCFGSEDEARLETSDLVSEVTLPCNFEILDVLKICRAIKEGEKTSSYTLRVYNCYFFCVAIQACLTRFIAHWEDKKPIGMWLSRVKGAAQELTKTVQAVAASRSSPHYHILFRIFFALDLCDNRGKSLMGDINLKLQPQLTAVQQDLVYRVNDLLWHSAISSSLNEFVGEKVREAVLDSLQGRFSKRPTSAVKNQPKDTPKPSVLKLKPVYEREPHQLTDGSLPGPMQETTSLLNFHAPTHTKPTAVPTDIPVNWSWCERQQVIPLMLVVELFLLVLHVFLFNVWGTMLFTFDVDKIPCIDIERRLEDIMAELESSDIPGRLNPEHIIKEIRVLAENKCATWNKHPWDIIYDFIKNRMHTEGNILEHLGESKPMIQARYSETEVECTAISVSKFQEHILKRILRQAQEVESHWLGSAENIHKELQETLSQVWKMIREDIDITDKAASITDKEPGAPLGVSHGRRFKRLGELDDIEKAIKFHTFALASTPAGHQDLPLQLTSLGVSYSDRFCCLGELDDLNKAIEYKSHAVELTPNGHPDLAFRFTSLGESYRDRFQRLGELDDLEEAIEFQSRAFTLTPNSHQDLPFYFFSLGLSYNSRFQHLGELGDLEKAIEFQSRALALTPDGHPDLPYRLVGLGASYRDRFQRLGKLDDLEKAIEFQSRGFTLTPDGHPDMPSYLFDLGTSYRDRFQRLGELGNLEKAIEFQSRALALTPDGHPKFPSRIMGLGASRRDRFERLGELGDLEKAIEYGSRALSLTPDGRPDLPDWLHNLGLSHVCRFTLLGMKHDLEKGIECMSRALALTPDGHSTLPDKHFPLAELRLLQYHRTRDPSDLQDSLYSFRMASQSLCGSPRRKFKYACRWAERASEHSSLNCIEAHQTALDLIPQFIWLGATTNQRYQDLDMVGGLAVSAASAAILFSDYRLALEWLERARCVVLNQSLVLRSSLDQLHSYHPTLAVRLQTVANQLHHAGSESRASQPLASGSLTPEQIGQQHRRLAKEYSELVSQARTLPGFENFLQPMNADGLIHAARNGPVVVITCYKDRCDALLILPGASNVEHLPLPNFDEDKAHVIRAQVNMHLFHLGMGRRAPIMRRPLIDPGADGGYDWGVLAVLWYDIVKPVLDFLGYTNNPSMDNLPHITWCPTGALSFLPLHAAGDYDKPQSRAFDYVISSYTPSLTALLSSTPSALTRDSRVLAIGQPNTPGQGSLPGTTRDLAFVKVHTQNKAEYSQLLDDQATVAAVLDAMETHDWVHLACHAHQNVEDPTKSGFFLHDDTLDLASINRRSFKNKGLAFLAACQTAKGDENLPDEAVHLASAMLVAGYTSVIATMWSVMDNDAPLVVDK